MNKVQRIETVQRSARPEPREITKSSELKKKRERLERARKTSGPKEKSFEEIKQELPSKNVPYEKRQEQFDKWFTRYKPTLTSRENIEKTRDLLEREERVLKRANRRDLEKIKRAYDPSEKYTERIQDLNKFIRENQETLGRGKNYEKSQEFIEKEKQAIKSQNKREMEQALKGFKPKGSYEDKIDYINKYLDKNKDVLYREGNIDKTEKLIEEQQKKLEQQSKQEFEKALPKFSDIKDPYKKAELLNKFIEENRDVIQRPENYERAQEIIDKQKSQIENFQDLQEKRGLKPARGFTPTEYFAYDPAKKKLTLKDPDKYKVEYYPSGKVKSIKAKTEWYDKYYKKSDITNKTSRDRSQYTPKEIFFDKQGNIKKEVTYDIYSTTERPRGRLIYKYQKPYIASEKIYKDGELQEYKAYSPYATKVRQKDDDEIIKKSDIFLAYEQNFDGGKTTSKDTFEPPKMDYQIDEPEEKERSIDQKYQELVRKKAAKGEEIDADDLRKIAGVRDKTSLSRKETDIMRDLVKKGDKFNKEIDKRNEVYDDVQELIQQKGGREGITAGEFAKAIGGIGNVMKYQGLVDQVAEIDTKNRQFARDVKQQEPKIKEFRDEFYAEKELTPKLDMLTMPEEKSYAKNMGYYQEIQKKVDRLQSTGEAGDFYGKFYSTPAQRKITEEKLKKGKDEEFLNRYRKEYGDISRDKLLQVEAYTREAERVASDLEKQQAKIRDRQLTEQSMYRRYQDIDEELAGLQNKMISGELTRAEALKKKRDLENRRQKLADQLDLEKKKTQSDWSFVASGTPIYRSTFGWVGTQIKKGGQALEGVSERKGEKLADVRSEIGDLKKDIRMARTGDITQARKELQKLERRADYLSAQEKTFDATGGFTEGFGKDIEQKPWKTMAEAGIGLVGGAAGKLARPAATGIRTTFGATAAKATSIGTKAALAGMGGLYIGASALKVAVAPKGEKAEALGVIAKEITTMGLGAAAGAAAGAKVASAKLPKVKGGVARSLQQRAQQREFTAELKMYGRGDKPLLSVQKPVRKIPDGIEIRSPFRINKPTSQRQPIVQEILTQTTRKAKPTGPGAKDPFKAVYTTGREARATRTGYLEKFGKEKLMRARELPKSEIKPYIEQRTTFGERMDRIKSRAEVIDDIQTTGGVSYYKGQKIRPKKTEIVDVEIGQGFRTRTPKGDVISPKTETVKRTTYRGARDKDMVIQVEQGPSGTIIRKQSPSTGKFGIESVTPRRQPMPGEQYGVFKGKGQYKDIEVKQIPMDKLNMKKLGEASIQGEKYFTVELKDGRRLSIPQKYIKDGMIDARYVNQKISPYSRQVDKVMSTYAQESTPMTENIVMRQTDYITDVTPAKVRVAQKKSKMGDFESDIYSKTGETARPLGELYRIKEKTSREVGATIFEKPAPKGSQDIYRGYALAKPGDKSYNIGRGVRSVAQEGKVGQIKPEYSFRETYFESAKPDVTVTPGKETTYQFSYEKGTPIYRSIFKEMTREGPEFVTLAGKRSSKPTVLRKDVMGLRDARPREPKKEKELSPERKKEIESLFSQVKQPTQTRDPVTGTVTKQRSIVDQARQYQEPVKKTKQTAPKTVKTEPMTTSKPLMTTNKAFTGQKTFPAFMPVYTDTTGQAKYREMRSEKDLIQQPSLSERYKSFTDLNQSLSQRRQTRLAEQTKPKRKFKFAERYKGIYDKFEDTKPVQQPMEITRTNQDIRTNQRIKQQQKLQNIQKFTPFTPSMTGIGTPSYPDIPRFPGPDIPRPKDPPKKPPKLFFKRRTQKKPKKMKRDDEYFERQYNVLELLGEKKRAKGLKYI